MNAVPAPAGQAHIAVPTQAVENVWAVFHHNLNSGSCTYIEMPINLKAVLGDEGISTIAFRFRNLIQAEVTVFEDTNRNVIQILPSHHDHGDEEVISGARDSKVKTSKKPKVARPANAFILYRQHHHPLLKAKHPEMHNNEISIILGSQWKKENEIVKTRFINMAKQLKARHQLEHPDYQYQPRKPSEKKRRMTQRKKAAIAEASQSRSVPSTLPISGTTDLTLAGNPITEPVPKFPETVGLNPMIELGGEDLDDQTLAAMLQQHNGSRPHNPNQIAHIRTENSPPVVYAQRSEESQQQRNFYAHFNPYCSNEEVMAEMDEMMKERQEFEDEYADVAQFDPDVALAKFDEEQDYLFNVELNRMCNWNDESLFQES